MCVCDDHGANAACMPEMDVRAADTGAADADGDFAFFEIFPNFDGFEAGLRFANPQLVVGVCKDADVGLGNGCCGCHGG